MEEIMTDSQLWQDVIDEFDPSFSGEHIGVAVEGAPRG
jgi:hypothetical protein